jgi:hypothetical protein
VEPVRTNVRASDHLRNGGLDVQKYHNAGTNYLTMGTMDE